MPITWKNINTPNFGSANQLTIAAGNNITQGIRGLRDIAAEIGKEQSDRATADVLDDIGRADINTLNQFDVGSLGDQVDTKAVTNALLGRRSVLDDQSQQDIQNQLAQDGIGIQQDQLDISRSAEARQANSSAVTNSLNKARLDDTILSTDERKRTIADTNKARGVSDTILNNLSNYDNVESLTQDLTRIARDNKVNPNDIESIKLNAITQWNNNINLSEEQKNKLTTATQDAVNYRDNLVGNAQDELNRVAQSKYGIKTYLLDAINEEPNEAELTKVLQSFDEISSDANNVFWGNTDTALLQEKFATEVGIPLTPSLARQLAAQSLNHGNWVTDRGLSEDSIDKAIASFKKSAGLDDSGEAIKWYKAQRQALDEYGSKFDKRIAKALKDDQKKAISNRQKSFKLEDFNPLSNLDYKTLRPDKLITLDFSKGAPVVKKNPPDNSTTTSSNDPNNPFNLTGSQLEKLRAN